MSRPSLAPFAGARVLVTGATGFIGGRLVEELVLRHGAEVRALVRDFRTAVRLARFPIELRRGDVTDETAVREAATGCDYVFHCAYGTAGTERQQRRVNVAGTRSVLEAARVGRARRVVHLSTLMAYGATPDGDLDESAPRRRFGNAYSDSKLAAERLAVRAAGRGLPVVILQPTAVYGPWGGVWTESVLRRLRSGKVVLVDDGRGLANSVYVDDLVEAMLLAALAPGVDGQSFLISGDEVVTWRDFHALFEHMVGAAPGTRTVSFTADEAVRHWRRHRFALPSALPRVVTALRRPDIQAQLMPTREVALARWAGSQLPFAVQTWIKRQVRTRLERRRAAAATAGPAAVGATSDDAALPVHALDPLLVRFFAARTRVRTDRARRLLGWAPRVDLATGMERTEAWARWANLLP